MANSGLARAFQFIRLLIVGVVLVTSVSADAQSTLQRARPRARNSGPLPPVIAPPETCTIGYSNTPPFFVNNAPESRPYSNFSQSPNGAVVNGYVPQGSVVQVVGDGPRFYTLPNTYINIRVLSVPDAQTAENARRSPQEMARVYRGIQGNRVTAGMTGFMRSADLAPAGSKIFTVRQNSPLLQIGNQSLDLQGRAVRLQTNLAGFYKVNRCCPQNLNAGMWDSFVRSAGQWTGLPTDSTCHDNYIFEVLNPDLKTVERAFDMDLRQCSAFASGLQLIDGSQASALAGVSRALASDSRFGIENVEFIPGANLMKIPTTPNPANPDCSQGPFGSCHYWRNQSASESARVAGSTDANNASLAFDSYMHPVSGCTFMRVLEEHQRTCRGSNCAVQWGDAYHNPAWAQAHQSHGNSYCVDIRPPRTDSSTGPITYNSANYDRAATQRLLQLMVRAGANVGQLGFSDPAFTSAAGASARGGWRTQAWGGHDNHIHVCFPPNATTNQTCQNGLGPNAGRSANVNGALRNVFGMMSPR